jgi:hypothetical protein
MFSFDLQDGFCALGINPTDRDYFTVNVAPAGGATAAAPEGGALACPIEQHCLIW